MLLTKGKFTVDRQRLVIHSTDIIAAIVTSNAIKDIILGGEFIITAEDILEKRGRLPAALLNEELPKGYTSAHHSIINIVYKPN